MSNTANFDDLTNEHDLFQYCEQPLLPDGSGTHKPCCGSTCWTDISLLFIVLGLALAGDQETNAASILHLQDADEAGIGRLFNVMVVV